MGVATEKKGRGMQGWPLYLVLSVVIALWAIRQWSIRRQVVRLTGEVPAEPPFPTPDRPEEELRAAASRGEARAMLELGDLAALERDANRALSWWAKAVEAGDDLAAYRLADLHQVLGDTENASRYFRRAVDAGVPGAANDFALFLISRGDDAGHELLLRAAEEGDALAMYNLASQAAERGDVREKERWSRASAEAGHPEGAYSLGLLSSERGDLEEAETWYRAAAEGRHPNAMFNLGLLLRERGDFDGAEHWYGRAAAAGDAQAAQNLVLLRRRRHRR
ncbi:tetratricopeptide repeat protein [Streptomyces hydrogenans]|uniref:tetratricopeptide repeat protein n=1 Tax=Streptomyces hydrogenans TaxID=1873719 RepID=UPI0035E36531